MRSVHSAFHTTIDPPGVGGFIDDNRKALDLIVILEELRLGIEQSIDLGALTFRHQPKGNASIYTIKGNFIELYFCNRTIDYCLSFLLKYLFRGAADVSHLDEEFEPRKGKTILNFYLGFDRYLPPMSNEDFEKYLKEIERDRERSR